MDNQKNDNVIITTSAFNKFKSILEEMRKGPPSGDETPASTACSLFADRLEQALVPRQHSDEDWQELKLVATVFCKPMSRADGYGTMGWVIPPDRNPDDEGYLVVFEKGGEAESLAWFYKKSFERIFGKMPENNN